MSQKTIVSLALKIIAAYLIFLTVETLILSLGSLAQSGIDSDSLASALIFQGALPLVYLLFCFWVIKNSEFLSNRIIKQEADDVKEHPYRLANVQAVAFSCIGLIALVDALPHLIQIVSYYYVYPRVFFDEEFGQILRQQSHWDIVGAVVKTGLGLFLFISPRGVVNLWRRLQATRWYKVA